MEKSDDGNKLNEAKVVMCTRINEQTGHSYTHSLYSFAAAAAVRICMKYVRHGYKKRYS